jgi:hypothetical protein
MFKLSDFFAPLGIVNIFIFLAFIACCEIIGFALAKTFIKKTPDFSRGAIWLLGLGLIVFIYFLSHFFLSFAFPTIVICLVIPLVPSINIYLKEKGWRSLFLFLRQNFLPLLLLLPIIPLIFIKSSLPPCTWDEMAYHYISPYTLYHEQIWDFGTGTFTNFPRLLETGFIALFSLTKTYAVARLLHFSVFITALITGYKFLKDYLGHIAALLFFALLIYHGENLVFQATSGYVDVGAASLVIIGLFCFLSFLLGEKIETIIAGFAFLGMAVGVKYSALIPLFSSGTVILFLMLKKKMFNKKYLNSYLIGLLLFILLGGYWYIKNFIHTGNPIYPFFSSFFSCRFAICPPTSPAWTDPFSLSHAKSILLKVLGGNKLLVMIFLLSIPFSLFHSERRIRKIIFFVIIMSSMEILLAASSFKYEPRFFYHWQFLSVLLVALPTTSLVDYKNLLKKFYLFFTIFLIIFTIYNSAILITDLYKDEREPGRKTEIQYALREININQWIENKFTKMREVIFWCDQNQKIEDLVVLDPDLIWSSYEGLMRVFMINCKIKGIDIDDISANEVVVFLRKRGEFFWIASLNECLSKLPRGENQGEEREVKYLRQVNNDIICNSEKVLPGLYKFPNKQ